MDISLNIKVRDMKSLVGMQNIHMQGTVSQILDLGLSSDFMSKNG